MDNFPKLIQKQQKVHLLAPLSFHTALEIQACTDGRRKWACERREPAEAPVTADGASARLGNSEPSPSSCGQGGSKIHL